MASLPADTPFSSRLQHGDALNAEFNASVFSQMVMTWLSPSIKTGCSRRLELSDAFSLRDRDRSDVQFELFQAIWAEERARPRPSIGAAMFRTFRTRILTAMVMRTLAMLLELAGPFVLRYIIRFLVSFTTDAPEPLGYGLALTGVLAALQFTLAILQAHAMYRIKLAGLGIRSVITTALFRGSLTLSSFHCQGNTVGKLINQMSADANKFLEAMP